LNERKRTAKAAQPAIFQTSNAGHDCRDAASSDAHS
jgi:hypothetical protein